MMDFWVVYFQAIADSWLAEMDRLFIGDWDGF